MSDSPLQEIRFRHLTPSENERYRAFLMFHGDIHLGNILRSSRGIRLVDFSLANIAHECSGLAACEELKQVSDLLSLNRRHEWIGPCLQYFLGAVRELRASSSTRVLSVRVALGITCRFLHSPS